MKDDPNYLVRTDWHENTPVIVTKAKYPGLTAEQLKDHLADPLWIIPNLNNNMEVKKLEPDEEGNLRVMLTIGTPMMVSTRNCFVTYYLDRDAEKGTSTTISSSLGNEALAAQHADDVGSNVLANMVITYQRIEPMEEGGHSITQVTGFNVNGWIPGWVQNLSSSRQ